MNDTASRHSRPDEPDFMTLMAVIQHLMTCYAFRPCPVLAGKVADHLDTLLTAPCSVELGPWQGAIEKLHEQWRILERLPRRQSRPMTGTNNILN